MWYRVERITPPPLSTPESSIKASHEPSDIAREEIVAEDDGSSGRSAALMPESPGARTPTPPGMQNKGKRRKHVYLGESHDRWKKRKLQREDHQVQQAMNGRNSAGAGQMLGLIKVSGGVLTRPQRSTSPAANHARSCSSPARQTEGLPLSPKKKAKARARKVSRQYIPAARIGLRLQRADRMTRSLSSTISSGRRGRRDVAVAEALGDEGVPLNRVYAKPAHGVSRTRAASSESLSSLQQEDHTNITGYRRNARTKHYDGNAGSAIVPNAPPTPTDSTTCVWNTCSDVLEGSSELKRSFSSPIVAKSLSKDRWSGPQKQSVLQTVGRWRNQPLRESRTLSSSLLLEGTANPASPQSCPSRAQSSPLCENGVRLACPSTPPATGQIRSKDSRDSIPAEDEPAGVADRSLNAHECAIRSHSEPKDIADQPAEELLPSWHSSDTADFGVRSVKLSSNSTRPRVKRKGKNASIKEFFTALPKNDQSVDNGPTKGPPEPIDTLQASSSGRVSAFASPPLDQYARVAPDPTNKLKGSISEPEPSAGPFNASVPVQYPETGISAALADTAIPAIQRDSGQDGPPARRSGITDSRGAVKDVISQQPSVFETSASDAPSAVVLAEATDSEFRDGGSVEPLTPKTTTNTETRDVGAAANDNLDTSVATGTMDNGSSLALGADVIKISEGADAVPRERAHTGFNPSADGTRTSTENHPASLTTAGPTCAYKNGLIPTDATNEQSTTSPIIGAPSPERLPKVNVDINTINKDADLLLAAAGANLGVLDPDSLSISPPSSITKASTSRTRKRLKKARESKRAREKASRGSGANALYPLYVNGVMIFKAPQSFLASLRPTNSKEELEGLRSDKIRVIGGSVTIKAPTTFLVRLQSKDAKKAEVVRLDEKHASLSRPGGFTPVNAPRRYRPIAPKPVHVHARPLPMPQPYRRPDPISRKEEPFLSAPVTESLDTASLAKPTVPASKLPAQATVFQRYKIPKPLAYSIPPTNRTGGIENSQIPDAAPSQSSDNEGVTASNPSVTTTAQTLLPALVIASDNNPGSNVPRLPLFVPGPLPFSKPKSSRASSFPNPLPDSLPEMPRMHSPLPPLTFTSPKTDVVRDSSRSRTISPAIISPQAKMIPLVSKENFLYWDPDQDSSASGIKSLEDTDSDWALPTLERTTSPTLPLGLALTLSPLRPLRLLRSPVLSPKPAANPATLKPKEITFTVYRHESPETKLCFPGTDISSDSDQSKMCWDKMVAILFSHLGFDDFHEALVVNFQLIVEDQETFTKAMPKYKSDNEVVICTVDETGRPTSKEIVERVKKERRKIREEEGLY